MPYYRRRRFTARRPTRSRRRFGRKRRSTYRRRRGGRYNHQSRPMGFPATKLVSFRYVSQVQLDPAAVGPIVAFDTYRATSIYDPEYFTGGHRPMGATQWNNFYQRYIVIGSKIRVKPVKLVGSEQAVTEAPGAVYGLILTADTAPPSATVISASMEQGLGRWRYTSVSGFSSGRSLSLGYSCKRFWNITDVKDVGARLGSSFNNNPTDNAYFVLYYAGLNPVTEPAPLDFVVTITYKCVLSVPNILPQSV